MFRSVNLIPFHSISQYLSLGGSGIAFQNIAGNILIFFPLGIYLPLLKKNKGLPVNLLIVFAVSLGAEILQWCFGLGSSDIDDLLLNCLGGLLGLLFYKLLARIFRDERRLRNAVVILSAAGMPLIYIFLFVLRFRL